MIFELVVKDLDWLFLAAFQSIDAGVWGLVLFFDLRLHFIKVKHSAIADVAVIVVIGLDCGVVPTTGKYIPKIIGLFLGVYS
jgi:hypothetical protein